MKKIIIPTIIVLIIALYFLLGANIFKIEGHSMNPTLKENELVFTTKNDFNLIERGDIIAFNHDGKKLIKRVIGLPNDVITILEDGTLLINGNIIEEEYLEFNVGESDIEYPFTVPENELFVLGDNRSDSLDSRVLSFGTIKENEILGVVNFVLWKPHKIK